ncbi:WD40-repeat-containing domain protein [Russula aff. rugulosa BPL654]|nr:WD40-repeat-containing domain protein [Russula aff. rugulosa BPL654]
MTSYPHTHLFHGENITVVISGHHIQLLHSNTGELLRSTASLEDTKLDALLKAGPIRCAAVDFEYTHLATVGDDKQLKVWAVESLQLLSEREIPKKPSQVLFTRSGRTIVVADKFGDVFIYPLVPRSTPTPLPPQNTESDTLASHENPSGGTLILGHTSFLTTFVLTSDESHIITADRDEHIRVSWFPQGHKIESFCLGHKKFISAIHIPRDPAAYDILISGGGDPVIKVWQWRAGRRLYDVAIEGVVRPFIAVRRAQSKRGYDSDGERKPPSRRWLARQRRKEAKAAAAATNLSEGDVNTVPEAEAEVDVGVDVDDDERTESDDETVDVSATPAPASGDPEEPSPAPVLVVQKIESSKIDGQLVIVFSAVGATALFWFALPLDPADAVSEEVLVHSYDLSRPVVTFTPVSGSPNCVCVSLDAHWSGEGPSHDVPIHASEVSPAPPLVSTLNSASVIPANEREFSALQLYEPITSLPKNIDASHNPMIRDGPDSADVGSAKGKRSAKAAGKMRTRMALLARGVQEEPPETEKDGDVMDES